ncbi:MAG: pyrimidine reductase family protein [Actinomycetales bacterium]
MLLSPGTPDSHAASLPPGGEELDDRALAAAYEYPEESTWLRAVMVSTLDGAGAGPDGRSASISGPPDRVVLALNRALSDAILVGWGTARAESYGPATVKPRWQWLRDSRTTPAPVIAVVSGTLEIDPSIDLISASQGRTVIVTCESAPEDRRKRLAEDVDVVVAGDERVDLRDAIRQLAERGLRRLDCEGGPSLLAQLVAADVLDELCLTLSPLLTAGDAGRSLRGPVLDPVRHLRLTHLLEEDSFLFGRWRRE